MALHTLFYGVPSGCSFGSIVALEWLGRPYQLCRIAMPEDVTTADYRRINPVAETPTLMTETGARISESMAILNHLGARGVGTGLSFAQGTEDFDRLNQMLAYLNTTFFGAFSPLWYALEHAELPESEKQALRNLGARKVVSAHANLEALLGDTPWLLGDHRTLADAYFIGIARWTRYHEVLDRRDYPKLQGLFERLEADVGVRFAHAIEKGETPQGSGAFQGHIRVAEALRRLPA
ncbi:glutathione S-transferase family protein [Corallococcus sp. CA041A]|uniref:glutathione S-transferase family protein n=1 Tax=Corallococcus sp. CA041A TaxID=2316727 RepID=UPI000EA0B2C1|nr:glutathione S-transferase family protein [Corallococcus sp. CA041A]RKH24892.1 glutathione S-transferase family protein [Corallococcus sp. CA041A]